jgi:hypothetical protein
MCGRCCAALESSRCQDESYLVLANLPSVYSTQTVIHGRLHAVLLCVVCVGGLAQLELW